MNVGNLLDGMQNILTIQNLLVLLAGVVLGMIVGVLPGLGAAATMAILLPVTLHLDPSAAVIMLAAIYYGAMYGGTITTVLMNTPGEAASVATALDGYPLARQGKAGPALVVAAGGAFFAGIFGTLVLAVVLTPFTSVTRDLGPPELFLIIMIGLALLVGLLGKNKLYGLVSALMGFAIATVGVDHLTGTERFTFGRVDLISGIPFQDIAVGLFGIGELFYSMAQGDHRRTQRMESLSGSALWPQASDWVRARWAIVRGAVIGFFTGLLPGAGATVAGLISYGVEKSVSKEPERFGKGAIEGVAAPEAANNGAVVGAMVPMLTLGIPGSTATAVLLSGFILWGLQPGPLLITQHPVFAWSLIASMLLGNLMLVCISVFAIKFFKGFMNIPYGIVIAVVVILCTVGAYTVNGQMSDVVIMLAAGLVGYYMKRFGFSPGATVIAVVLSPQAEETLRQTLSISNGSLSIFWTRTASRTILIVIVAVALLLIGWSRARHARNRGVDSLVAETALEVRAALDGGDPQTLDRTSETEAQPGEEGPETAQTRASGRRSGLLRGHRR